MNELLDTFAKHDCPWCMAAINTNMFGFGLPGAFPSIELKKAGAIIIDNEITNIYCCQNCKNKYKIINDRIIREILAEQDEED